ncbi:MAG: hypothetical protein MZW92_65630 [Comamonadaceae bacterium]|nr:hypothetical protein [Comamonadaceae bacterium]
MPRNIRRARRARRFNDGAHGALLPGGREDHPRRPPGRHPQGRRGQDRAAQRRTVTTPFLEGGRGTVP